MSTPDEVTPHGDVGVYGLLSDFRSLHVDSDGHVARAFTDQDDARLAATANRANNVVEGASSALHAIGDLLMAHDPKVAPVHSMDVGAAVVLLTGLIDAARLIKADARYELELRAAENRKDPASGAPLRVVRNDGVQPAA